MNRISPFCVACARGSSPATRPLRSTMMRVARLRISGSSLEIRITPLPFDASSSMSAWISALAPTSTPRVGSSRIRMRQPAASHFASTIFC